MSLFKTFSIVTNAQASSQVHQSGAFFTAFANFSLLSTFLMYFVGDLAPTLSLDLFLWLRVVQINILFIHFIK